MKTPIDKIKRYWGMALTLCLAGLAYWPLWSAFGFSNDPLADTPSSDPNYLSSAPTDAHQFTLTNRIDRDSIASFAQLSEKTKKKLEELVRHPFLKLTIQLINERLLIRLPSTHPLGAAELVLADDQKLLAVYLPAKKLRLSFPRELLPDLLEGTPASSRADFELTIEPSPLTVQDQEQRRKTKLQAHTAQLLLHYFPDPARPKSWPVRITFRAVSPDEFPQPLLTQGLFQLALPFLEGEEGMGVFETLGNRMGRPISWSTTVVNEAKPSGVAPAILTTIKYQGRVKVPLSDFSIQRPGYSLAEKDAFRPATGLQVIPETTLRLIREAKPAGPLFVHNRSTSTAYLFIDGAFMGWVGPKKKMKFNGLPAGYYRVYGMSPTGLRAWGPSDVYIPGPVTLW